MQAPTLMRVWTAALLVLGLAVIALTYRDYGVTWDESIQIAYGESVAELFRTGEQTWDPEGHGELIRYYGPAFDLLAALIYAPFPDAKFEIRHFMVAITALLSVLALIRYGELLNNKWICFFAPLVLVMVPRYYGHGFANCKDIPFACLLTWTIYASCRFVHIGGSWKWVVLTGLGLGGTLAVRPGGLLVLLGLFVILLGWAAFARLEIRKLLLRSLVIWVIGWTLMVSVWPWAHESPVLNPVRAVLAATSYPVTIPVLFEGRVYMSDQLPRYYFLKYLLITTPLFALILFALGAVRAVRSVVKAPRDPLSLVFIMLGVWFAAPLLMAMVKPPNTYDGLRHILFLFPPLAIFAAIGCAWIIQLVKERYRIATAVALALLCMLPIRSLITLHPYQATFFNASIGGLGGAQDRYETDYWATSYKEATEWINQRAAENPGRKLKVLIAMNDYSRACVYAYLESGVQVTPLWGPGKYRKLPPAFDYYVGISRYGFDRHFPDSPVVNRIGRDGATFTVIRGR